MIDIVAALQAHPILLLLIKVTLLLGSGAAIAALLRKRSAAARHFAWSLTIVCTLAVAAIAFFAPPMIVPVHYTAPTIMTITSSEAPVITKEPVTRSLPLPPAPARIPIPFAIWIGGALVSLAWLMLGNIGLARIARGAVAIDEDQWRPLIDRDVRVARSASVGAPVTWGWLRPIVLLPADSATWPAERQRAALMHELAHVTRHDYLVQLLGSLACAVYWFHPLMWLAVRQLRRESEHASDDRVLACGIVPPDYAAHLLAVASEARVRRLSGFLALGMASHLETRLKAVLDDSRKRAAISGGVALAAVLIAAIVIVPLARARAGLREKNKPSKSSERHSTFTRTLDAAPGETLDLALKAGGSVEVRAWDEPRVSIEARIGFETSPMVDVDAQRSANGVRVETVYNGTSRSHRSSIHFSIRVPRRFDIKLHSIGGGLDVKDLEGSFEGNTGGGEFVFDRVKGSAHLSTGGGGIRVTDCELSGSMSTGGGKVWFSRVRGGLTGSSGSGPVVYAESSAAPEEAGSLDYVNVKDDDQSFTVGDRFEGLLVIEKAGGHVDVESVPHGARITTGGGELRIGRGAGVVEAHTGGGDITVGPIAGSVKASTGAGEVTITLDDARGVDQSIEVFTGKGRVVLELPASIDARFDLETAYTKGYPRRSHIESDWNLATEETQAWDESVGTARKYVRARGGSGKSLIHVKAVNGDVIVRRR